MKAKFFCKTGLLAGAKYVIDREARIGKDANNHIVLDTKIVSGQHARIFFDDNEKSFFLQDLQSRNGTRLDGVRVNEAEKLDDLHVITVAEKFDFIFQLVGAAGDVVPERTADQHPAQKTAVAPKEVPRQTPRSKPQDDSQKTMPGGQIVMPPSFDKEATARPKDDSQKTMPGGQIVMPPIFDKEATARPEGGLQKTIQGAAPALPDFQNRETADSAAPTQKQTYSAGTFFLEINRPGKEATVFTLREGENTVGRLQDCDIPIDDVSISRQHAVVTVKSKKVMVKDLDSKNRTFIGDRAITDEAEIRLDTRLKFGAVEAYLIYKTA